MNEAKVHLSADEFELVKNAEWILTKNRIIQKVYNLFGRVSERMKKRLELKASLFSMLQSGAKISRGENYQGLPYVVLDYPREFRKEDVFAIRSLFWWGHYFSITLHLKGSYKKIFAENLIGSRELLGSNGFHLSVSTEEWSHELNDAHFIPMHDLPNSAIGQRIAEQSFLKVSAKIDFSQWDLAEEAFLRHFEILIQSIEG